MGEIIDRGETSNDVERVMALYELLPDEIKAVTNVKETFKVWFERIRSEFERTLIMSGIHLSELDRSIIGLRLFSDHLARVKKLKDNI